MRIVKTADRVEYARMGIPQQLTAISSMAPRRVLAEFVALWQARCGVPVLIESVGGVEATRRVEAGGERFDLVFLASDVIKQLLACGRVLAGSRVDLMRSPTAVAVAAGTPKPEIGSEDALRAAVAVASGVGVSTGPSGRALRALFARWGIAPRIVEAPPGVPVGRLLAEGEAALGFQQLSELIHEPGIEIVGELPAPIAIDTVFSAGVVSGSPHVDAARGLLELMASPEAEAAKRRQGMQPITGNLP